KEPAERPGDVVRADAGRRHSFADLRARQDEDAAASAVEGVGDSPGVRGQWIEARHERGWYVRERRVASGPARDYQRTTGARVYAMAALEVVAGWQRAANEQDIDNLLALSWVSRTSLRTTWFATGWSRSSPGLIGSRMPWPRPGSANPTRCANS